MFKIIVRVVQKVENKKGGNEEMCGLKMSQVIRSIGHVLRCEGLFFMSEVYDQRLQLRLPKGFKIGQTTRQDSVDIDNKINLRVRVGGQILQAVVFFLCDSYR